MTLFTLKWWVWRWWGTFLMEVSEYHCTAGVYVPGILFPIIGKVWCCVTPWNNGNCFCYLLCKTIPEFLSCSESSIVKNFPRPFQVLKLSNRPDHNISLNCPDDNILTKCHGIYFTERILVSASSCGEGCKPSNGSLRTVVMTTLLPLVSPDTLILEKSSLALEHWLLSLL